MKPGADSHGHRILIALVLAAINFQGCVSVKLTSRDGKPKLFGFGSAKPLDDTGGKIYRIVAPGLSVRLHSYAPGLSLGWHETSLFYPSTSGDADSAKLPVAIQNKCVGMNLALNEIMIGFERSFAVPLPPSGSSVIQRVSYSAINPTQTIAERKETK